MLDLKFDLEQVLVSSVENMLLVFILQKEQSNRRYNYWRLICLILKQCRYDPSILRYLILISKRLSLNFIMSQPSSRIVINKPIANRSPSPDITSRHLLLKTQPVEIVAPKKSQQKIPLMQEVVNLHNQNKRLKDLLANNRFGDLKKQLEEKEEEIRELKRQLSDNVVSRRLFQSSNQSVHQSLRGSTDRKRMHSEMGQQRNEEIEELRRRVTELTKENEEVRKNLLMKSIRSDDKKEVDFNRVKKQALEIMNRKIEEIEGNYNRRIKDLNDRIQRLNRYPRRSQDNHYSSRSPSRIMQVVTASKRQRSGIKRDSQKYQTPRKGQDESHIEAQLTVSKNNIKELQKQNNNLLNDNLNLKKAYELLLRKTNQRIIDIQDSSSSSPVPFEIQSQLNRLTFENKSLKQTLQDLRVNTASLENQNQELRMKLNTINTTRLSVSTKVDQKDQSKIINELEKANNILTKQKDVIKNQLFVMNSTNEKLLFEARGMEEENMRLKEENQYLRSHVAELTSQQSNLNKGNSKLEQIWNQLNNARKKADTLELKNKQLEKELIMRGTQNTILQGKDQQIFKLKDELNRALTQQRKISSLSNGQNDELRRQLSSLRTRLSQADKMLQQVNNLDTSNKKQVSGLLRGLEEVKRMLDRISFESLEVSLRDVGFRYKNAVEERIQLLRRLKEKTNDSSRIEIQNQRLKRQIVDLNVKFINEKTNRQFLEAKLQQQSQQSQILKSQINQLHRVVNEYITKKIDIRISEESRVKELEAEIIEDKTERDVGELRELEAQVRAVGARLEDILKKVNIEFQDGSFKKY